MRGSCQVHRVGRNWRHVRFLMHRIAREQGKNSMKCPTMLLMEQALTYLTMVAELTRK